MMALNCLPGTLANSFAARSSERHLHCPRQRKRNWLGKPSAAPVLCPAHFSVRCSGQSPAKMSSAAVMTPGKGEESYDKNSTAQGGYFEQARESLFQHLRSPALQAAIAKTLHGDPNGVVCVADFGSSTGRNSIAAMSQLVTSLKENYEQEHETSRGSPFSTMVYFSDLPANDFNNIFQLLDEDKKKADDAKTIFSKESEGVYASTIAGSFYDRILPPGVLHVASCNIAIHWMSGDPVRRWNERLPPGELPLINPSAIWYDPYDPESDVTQAYETHAREDLKNFLSARAQEMVPGGLLLMLVVGLEATDEKEREDNSSFLTALTDAWKELILEGKLAPETLRDYNHPVFLRSPQHITRGVEDSGNEFSVLGITPLNARSSLFQDLEDNPESIRKACNAYVAFVKSLCANLLLGVWRRRVCSFIRKARNYSGADHSRICQASNNISELAFGNGCSTKGTIDSAHLMCRSRGN